jgi:predicted esterase
MAFRAAVHAGGAGVIAVGGDVPPELFADRARAFPPLLIARGTADEWYTAEKLELDLASLKRHGANVRTVVYDAAHEWTPAVAEAAGAWLNELCVSRSIVS